MDNRDPESSILPALAGIIAVLLTGVIVWLTQEFGRLSAHMATHIAAMNVLAPLAAMKLVRWRAAAWAWPTGAFWLLAALQISALWFWHIPAIQALTMHSLPGLALMHMSLFGIAALFWTMVLQARANTQWQIILGLVVTGKLSCLLAALFIFSPRPLFAAHHHEAASSIADQQLAGLLMITACPLSYVAAGLILALQLSGLLPTRTHARAV